ncbi:MAG: 16S rRNA (adenine(1518)-N(6)/adenine(1519)-N(6))-dimethyltransferase RsmA [Betaproteobacteria bacterium]|nr:16S rRNA (adenine(1518)-N(6)/adenine(1519)-N(6))-dimethyltransferase RsmA [Betaproteobacteria bacterium]
MNLPRPRRRLSQNFLVDKAVISEIVTAIAPAIDDVVVEIGPGRGALTRPLLSRLAHLTVVEVDRDLAARLASSLPAQRLTVVAGDALKFDFASLGTDLRVVGNLPYHISTPLLFRFAVFASRIRDIHVMLQKEVVARMVARPASSEYGRLSVMLQYRFRMEKLIDVPAAAFRPVPKVDSAVVRLLPHGEARPCSARDEALLGQVVARAFAQRRKTLRNTLKGCLSAADFSALGIAPAARAQELAVSDFVAIADYLEARRGDAR